MTTNEFITRSNLIHDNKYTYENCIYENYKECVEITCKIHGCFKQKPIYHLSGRGCSICGGRLKISVEEFIKRANKLHNNKYLYDNVIYVNMHTHVEIVCVLHGMFLQTPDNHLRGGGDMCGNGCPACNIKRKSNNEEFIIKANKIHNYKYDYSLIDYKNHKTKINILCGKHGIFKQIPNNHLLGNGCPKCNSSKGELLIEKILIENHISFKQQYTFEDLICKKLLKFDFGVLNAIGNLKYLIEFNGIQHYEFREKFHHIEEEFKIAQHRDKLKQDYCLKNNIPLYIIKYNEDIIEKLQKIIKQHEKC